MNKYFLIPIFFIFFISFVYSIPACWENINCSVSNTVTDASIIYPDYTASVPFEEYCVINGIDVTAGTNHLIEIELIQGGYKDSSRNQNWIIGEQTLSMSDPIYFYLNKSVSPVYLNCYDLYPTTANSFNINPSRIVLLQTWTASYNGGYFDYIDALPKGNDFEVTATNSIVFLNTLNFAGSITAHLMGTITQLTTNYPANKTNPFILAIAWLFMAFGLVGMILLLLTAHDREWY